MSSPEKMRLLQELYYSGKISDDDFARAKAALVAGAPVDDKLAETILLAQVAHLDQRWEAERDQYMVRFKQARFLPTKTTSIVMGVVMVVAGVVWTAGVANMRGASGSGIEAWPLLGLAFILMWLGFSVFCYFNAVRYEEAHAAYQRRRDQLIAGGLFGTAALTDEGPAADEAAPSQRPGG